MKRFAITSLLSLWLAATLTACSVLSEPVTNGAKDYQLTSTFSVVVTNEAGDKMARRANETFVRGVPSGVIVEVFPADTRQTLLGVGTSFTESSAFVLAHLTDAKRHEVMRSIYGRSGANFSIARTPIGSTDFSVQGKYSYAEAPGDASLASFSIAPDRAGFSRDEFAGVANESYDVLPMIKEALAIKAAQDAKDLRIIASAWTAPPWMKTIETWYIKPTPENNWQGTGGDLKPEYESTYADYLVRFLDAYADAGVDIWGLTPVNEPHGNSGQWESMHFSARSQAAFVRDHLGPKLQASAHSDLKVLIYDQNRDGLEAWTDEFYADREAAKFVYGAAVHWYSSTIDVYEDVFERVHDFHPDFSIIHTEGTIDDLGKEASESIADPDNFTEANWFANDAFWWNATATDWAYTASWASDVEKHPIYTPVHRYARDIIEGFDHWLEGWVDWNIVLDERGGPNHVGNFCGAPIMIDTQSGEVYYTPVYYVLAQLSRSIRPGDKAVRTSQTASGLERDALHTSASLSDDGLLSVQLLNTTKKPIELALRVGAHFVPVDLDANALQTVQVQLSAVSKN